MDPSAPVPAENPARRRSPRGGIADTPRSPDSEKAAPAVVGLLNNAVQGAHEGIGRLAGRSAAADLHRIRPAPRCEI